MHPIAVSLLFASVETAAFILPAFLPELHLRLVLLSSYAMVHFAGLQESWRRLKRQAMAHVREAQR